MGRRKAKTTLVPPLWIQTLRAKFLDLAFKVNPAARELLATKGYQGELSASAWAQTFGVNGTWIEQWAKETLEDWKKFPEWVTFDPQTGALAHVTYDGPKGAQTDVDTFSYSTSGNIPSPYAIGVVAGGRLPDPLMGRFDQVRDARRVYREELQRKEQATTAHQRRVADARIDEAKEQLESASQAAAEFDPWDWYVNAQRAALDSALKQHRGSCALRCVSRDSYPKGS